MEHTWNNKWKYSSAVILKILIMWLSDIQQNIDYQKTVKIESDDTGFGNFVHFSSESRLYNFRRS